MTAICGRILERSPTFRTHFHAQRLGDLARDWRALTSPKRQTNTQTPFFRLFLHAELGVAGRRAPRQTGWRRGRLGTLGKAKWEGRTSMPCAPTQYTKSPSLLLIQGLKQLLLLTPTPPPFTVQLQSRTWPLRTTCVFSSSPFLVSSKIIKPNPTCVACLCQGRWERPGWRGGCNAAWDSGERGDGSCKTSDQSRERNWRGFGPGHGS